MPVRRPVEWRARLDGQRIGTDVGWRRGQVQHVGQAALPVLVALPRPAQDQVHVPRSESSASHHGASRGDMVGTVPAAQSDQHVIDRGLHP